MKTRIATALAHGNPQESARAIATSLKAKLGAPPSLLVAFGSTAQPLGELARGLVEAFPGTLLIGASTAGEFTEERDAKKSAAAFALAGDYKIFAGLGGGLRDNPERAIDQAMDGLPEHVHGYPYRTTLLLLDPLAGNGEETTLMVAARLGETARLAGGAAGDDLQMKATQVACGTRATNDALVIAMVFSKAPLGVGVCHGHQPISPPLRVTRARGNVVFELDGERAWDVWIRHTRDRSSMRGIDLARMAKDDEGSYLLRYEAGLSAGDAYKIRAPLSRGDDGSISFACGIPEGAVIRITESSPERQIDSAREAARRARAQLGGPAAGAIVFDCICRNLILEDDFARAVRGISEELGGVPLAGFETYGEIALDAGDMSGFHNTTSVVLAFPTS